MHRSSSIPPHRQSRRAQRRQKVRRLALVAVVSLITLWAFGAGYLWWQLKAKSAAAETPTEQTDPKQRAQALELLDRAVEARHAELDNEAVRLAVQARTLDPDVPGADLFAAEMALRQNNTGMAEAAAREALEQRQYTADAQVILALSGWMLRGQAGADTAGASSLQLLAEAADAELSNVAVRFFAGDLQRAVGRPSEAHQSLLRGLHRQQPWDSFALLVAKLALAIDEAGPRGSSAALLAAGDQADFFASTAIDLRSTGRGSALGAVDPRAFFSAKQLACLALDPALASVAGLSSEKGSVPFLPFAEVTPSEIAPKVSAPMP